MSVDAQLAVLMLGLGGAPLLFALAMPGPRSLVVYALLIAAALAFLTQPMLQPDRIEGPHCGNPLLIGLFFAAWIGCGLLAGVAARTISLVLKRNGWRFRIAAAAGFSALEFLGVAGIWRVWA